MTTTQTTINGELVSGDYQRYDKGRMTLPNKEAEGKYLEVVKDTAFGLSEYIDMMYYLGFLQP